MREKKVVMVSTGGTIAMKYDPIVEGRFLPLQGPNWLRLSLLWEKFVHWK